MYMHIYWQKRKRRNSPVSGQSNKLRELLAMSGEVFTPDDRPKIGEHDELLAALKREHGEAGRPDLAILR
jgi:hypothetical protein